MDHTLRSIAVAALGLGLVGCIISPDNPDGDGGTTDPEVDRACPSDHPHLAVALSHLSNESSSQLARLDHRLRLCRGVVFDRDEGYLQAVGGTPAGHELVGFDSGRVYLLDDTTLVWGVETDLEARSVFTMTYQGRQVAAVLWVNSHGSGEALELLELADGTPIQSFDVDSSVIAATSSIDGSGDRIAGLIDWEGIQHYRAEAGADTLGTTGEQQVAAPRSGNFNGLDTSGEQALIAADNGVLYWSDDRSLAFLGPVRCAWPAFEGESVPDGEEEYLAVAPIPDAPSWFLTAANATLPDDERRSHLFQMNSHGECFVVASADTEHRITDIAWSGR